MLKDLYPVNKLPFENLLLNNNYELNEETFKIFIHDKYCIHVSKKKELCRRKKIVGKDFCAKHLPSGISFSNKCIYSNCKKITKKKNICHIHEKIYKQICNTPLPDKDDEELMFFGHNIYNCKIYKKEIKIIIKDYLYLSNYKCSFKDHVMIKYNNFSINNFISTIYYNFVNKLLKIIEGKIDIKTLIFIINLFHEINKNGKKVPVSLNFDKYYTHIDKKRRNIKIPIISGNSKNMQMIIYNKYGYEYFQKCFKNKIKKENVNISQNNCNDYKINKISLDIDNIFDEIKTLRNNFIIENDLHIFILRDPKFQDDMFRNTIGLFNEKTLNNSDLDDILDVAIKYNIIPINYKEDKILLYKDYKERLLKLKINHPLNEKIKIYINIYIDFVFKSYNYIKYNKLELSKEDNKIKNKFIKNNNL